MAPNIPLAERMRPATLDDFLGQGHLVGPGATLRNMIESDSLPSMILWGPPGVGKTTLARVISNRQNRPFYSLSAVHSGVKEVRDTIEKAKSNQFFDRPNAVLFIDEIHRFSKSQQDSLLGAVEEGTLTLIGATTENPSFEVISPLLSRCQTYTLKPLGVDDLIRLTENALKKDTYLSLLPVVIKEYGALLRYSGGDARKLYNALELSIEAEKNKGKDGKKIILNDENIKKHLQENLAIYDKQGEMHYDIISAFIKSIRGSDPNGAVYWLARMVEGGEDPLFIARRLVILAAEDVGLANPNALLLAQSCFEAVHQIGWPESRIILSEATIYLATSPKSNAAYLAISNAQSIVHHSGDLPVPLHIRNAPTRLMKELGYGKDYRYAHDYDGNFTAEEFLPETLQGKKLYDPQANPREYEIRERLKSWWKDKYNY